MIATSSMSFAEFEQLPDAPGKRELIDGELIELPPARLSHNTLAHNFHRLLLQALNVPSIWIEMGYRIRGGWFQPDVSISYPEQQIANDYYIGAPLLAIEILSPSNTAGQLDRKLALYFEEGAGEVWVINPQHRTMTVYQRTETAVSMITVHDRYTSQLLGITVELSNLLPR